MINLIIKKIKRIKSHPQVCELLTIYIRKKIAQQFFLVLCFNEGEEALAKARDQEIQRSNQRMYQELKKKNQNKNDKVDRILDFLTQKISPDSAEPKKDCNQDSDEEIDDALNTLVQIHADADLEVMNDNKKKANDELESKEETPANNNSCQSSECSSSQSTSSSSQNTNSLPPSLSSFFAKGSEEVTQHSNVAIYHTQKLHVFIDNLTSNHAIDDEDKEEITLAFYDHSLKPDVVPYFDSLCLTNKSVTEIANSLIWFIRCIKNKKCT